MRSITQASFAAINSPETTEVFLFLLALSHPTMATLYFANNTVDVVSNGQTYMAFPFDISIPDDRDEPGMTIRLSIDNVDRRIVQAVRTITSPAIVTLTVIRAADPNVPVAGPFACTLRNVSYNAQTVAGDLAPFEDIMNEPFPQDVFDPGRFPGLFQ